MMARLNFDQEFTALSDSFRTCKKQGKHIFEPRYTQRVQSYSVGLTSPDGRRKDPLQAPAAVFQGGGLSSKPPILHVSSQGRGPHILSQLGQNPTQPGLLRLPVHLHSAGCELQPISPVPNCLYTRNHGMPDLHANGSRADGFTTGFTSACHESGLCLPAQPKAYRSWELKLWPPSAPVPRGR